MNENKIVYKPAPPPHTHTLPAIPVDCIFLVFCAYPSLPPRCKSWMGWAIIYCRTQEIRKLNPRFFLPVLVMTRAVLGLRCGRGSKPSESITNIQGLCGTLAQLGMMRHLVYWIVLPRALGSSFVSSPSWNLRSMTAITNSALHGNGRSTSSYYPAPPFTPENNPVSEPLQDLRRTFISSSFKRQ
jgi:hypothetical protein